MKPLHQQAFSLIELAIAIAIIGILIGAALVGNDFVQRAKVAEAIAQMESLTQAHNRFISQHGQPPGDFNNATNIWGTRATCPPTPNSTPSGTGTCNGDGDKRIESTGGNIFETFSAFQHLNLAGLLPGSYTGSSAHATQTDQILPGTNAPGGPHENSAYYFTFIGDSGIFFTTTTSNRYYPGRYGAIMIYGGYLANNFSFNRLITPEEMYKWDTKTDDARPASGRVLSHKPSLSQTRDCATTSDPATALYNTSFEGAACSVIYVMNP